jgi:hypothetical protein
MDGYLAPGGLCHPSDNFGGRIAAAEQAGTPRRIYRSFAPESKHRSGLARAEAVKQLDAGVGNTLVSVCARQCVRPSKLRPRDRQVASLVGLACPDCRLYFAWVDLPEWRASVLESSAREPGEGDTVIHSCKGTPVVSPLTSRPRQIEDPCSTKVARYPYGRKTS